jgi:hypothetical protein
VLADAGDGRPRDALPRLERALTLVEAAGDPTALATTRLALADALWKVGGDCERAVTLARDARDGFRAARDAKGEAGAEAWLARATGRGDR